jgi:FtsH-binding integral membrane protein
MNPENSKEQFSPQQSLAVIQSMIETAKNQFSENGHLYLLWGWLVFICSVAQFILLSVFKYEYHYMVWMLTWLAFIYQTFYLIKQKKKEKVRTYTDSIIGFVWLVFVVMMFLFGFLFGRELGDNYYRMISPGFLALYGMPTFLSGILLRFRPLIIGGIGCWLLSILSLFIPYEFQLLLLSVAMIIAWIIPGYLLRAKYKKVNA